MKKYIKFLIQDVDNTRIGRKDYLLGFVFLITVLIITLLFLSILNINSSIFLLIYIIMFIFCFIILVAISIKRLHDIKMSHWNMILIIIPLLNILLFSILFFVKSEDKDNSYIKKTFKN